MLSFALTAAIGMIILAMALNLWRLSRGPGAPDRILALDTLAINTIALVILFGLALDDAVYLDVALLIAMTSFVGTVALCKFLLSGDVIE